MAKNGSLPKVNKEILAEMGNVFGVENVRSGLQQTLEGVQKQGGQYVAQLMALHDVPEDQRPPHNESLAKAIGNDNCWQCQVDVFTKAIEDGKKHVERLKARIEGDIFG